MNPRFHAAFASIVAGCLAAGCGASLPGLTRADVMAGSPALFFDGPDEPAPGGRFDVAAWEARMEKARKDGRIRGWKRCGTSLVTEDYAGFDSVEWMVDRGRLRAVIATPRFDPALAGWQEQARSLGVATPEHAGVVRRAAGPDGSPDGCGLPATTHYYRTGLASGPPILFVDGGQVRGVGVVRPASFESSMASPCWTADLPAVVDLGALVQRVGDHGAYYCTPYLAELTRELGLATADADGAWRERLRKAFDTSGVERHKVAMSRGGSYLGEVILGALPLEPCNEELLQRVASLARGVTTGSSGDSPLHRRFDEILSACPPPEGRTAFELYLFGLAGSEAPKEYRRTRYERVLSRIVASPPTGPDWRGFEDLSRLLACQQQAKDLDAMEGPREALARATAVVLAQVEALAAREPPRDASWSGFATLYALAARLELASPADRKRVADVHVRFARPLADAWLAKAAADPPRNADWPGYPVLVGLEDQLAYGPALAERDRIRAARERLQAGRVQPMVDEALAGIRSGADLDDGCRRYETARSLGDIDLVRRLDKARRQCEKALIESVTPAFAKAHPEQFLPRVDRLFGLRGQDDPDERGVPLRSRVLTRYVEALPAFRDRLLEMRARGEGDPVGLARLLISDLESRNLIPEKGPAYLVLAEMTEDYGTYQTARSYLQGRTLPSGPPHFDALLARFGAEYERRTARTREEAHAELVAEEQARAEIRRKETERTEAANAQSAARDEAWRKKLALPEVWWSHIDIDALITLRPGPSLSDDKVRRPPRCIEVTVPRDTPADVVIEAITRRVNRNQVYNVAGLVTASPRSEAMRTLYPTEESFRKGVTPWCNNILRIGLDEVLEVMGWSRAHAPQP